MMFTARTLCLLLCVLVVMAGCGGESRDTIRFGLNTSPITLDPRYVTDAVSQRLCRLIYRQLVDFNAAYRATPSLAVWERLTDTHYRFYLRSNRSPFHNGMILTAKDVKATFDSILDPLTASPHRATLEHVTAIDVVDEDTVDFHLRRPDTLFPGRLNIGILPSALLEKNYPFNNRPIGSGPFRFMEWKDGQDLRLVRNVDGQSVEFVTVKDPTIRVLKLARGEIDLLQGNLTSENVSWLRGQEGVVLQKQRGDIFTYIGFNLDDSTTGQLQVRHAIAHAIDRDSIIHYVMADTARKAGSLLPPEHWAGHDDLQGLQFAPEKSRELLKQAGYSIDNPLQVTFKTSSDPFRIRLATIIQDQLHKVGIDMAIQSYDWGTFYGDIKQGHFQMYSLSWVGLKLPDIFRHVFHSEAIPPNGANRGRFSDMQADSIIERAASTQDLTTKAELYMILQERLHELLPYVPLWYEDNILARRESVTGYTLSADGNYDGMISIQKVKEVRHRAN